MKKVFLALSLIALTGAGCINVRTSESTDLGGVFATADAGANWTAKSTLPLAGGMSTIATTNVTNITFDPSDADVLYVGTTENGVLVSYDNAESWQRIKEPELRSGTVRGVAVDPSDICVVYVAKGPNVMKTTDCNRNYDTQAFVETSGKAVMVVRVDWYNPSTVWIGTEYGDIVKSTDNGRTWSTMKRAGDTVIDIMIDNSDSRIILAATAHKGIWRSTDGGATWTNSEEQTKHYQNSWSGYQLAQSSDASVIYYVNDYGLLRSRDHGATWEAPTLLTKPGSVRIYAMAVNPDDANNLYYGTASTLYSSTDGGANWATRELPTSRPTSAVIVDPNDTKTVFLGAATIEK